MGSPSTYHQYAWRWQGSAGTRRATPRAGRWRSALRILALAGALGSLVGCREAPPLTPAWVRVSALTALHPNQAMLADIDRRLQALAEQRERLRQRPPFPAAPNVEEHRTSPLEALPPPEPVAIPASPTAQLNEQDKEALRRMLAHQRNREFARRESALRAEYARRLASALAALDAEEAARGSEIARRYRQQITGGQIREEKARQETEIIRREGDFAQQQSLIARQRYDAALAQHEEARSAALRAPNSRRARQRAQRATSRAEELQRRLAAAEERAREGERRADAASARATEISGQVKAARESYRRELDVLAEEIRGAKGQAEAASDRELSQILARLRKQMDQEIAAAIAAKEVELAAQREPGAIPLPAITFPAVPARAAQLEMAGMAAAFARAGAANTAGQDAALGAVAASAERLRRERSVLAGAIEQDVRDAVTTLARQHGYAVVFDHPAGEDATVKARRWLAGYWSP